MVCGKESRVAGVGEGRGAAVGRRHDAVGGMKHRGRMAGSPPGQTARAAAGGRKHRGGGQGSMEKNISVGVSWISCKILIYP